MHPSVSRTNELKTWIQAISGVVYYFMRNAQIKIGQSSCFTENKEWVSRRGTFLCEGRNIDFDSCFHRQFQISGWKLTIKYWLIQYLIHALLVDRDTTDANKFNRTCRCQLTAYGAWIYICERWDNTAHRELPLFPLAPMARQMRQPSLNEICPQCSLQICNNNCN